MDYSFLPTLNAIFNASSAVLLTFGFANIRKGQIGRHKTFMISALVASGLFLTSYLIYHYNTGTHKYPYHDWTRPLYFVVLIPHVFLAAAMIPFIILAVRHAFKGRFEKHKRITRWLWWVWMYVSVSGIVVYLMLYHL
jgi:uncharacterized membrane protein YozB (DUF420 family)